VPPRLLGDVPRKDPDPEELTARLTDSGRGELPAHEAETVVVLQAQLKNGERARATYRGRDLRKKQSGS
jgi:hypothetical protein